MIIVCDNDRSRVIEAITRNPKDIVIGVDSLAFPYVNENNLEDFVGGVYRVEFPTNEPFWKSMSESFRLEGFNVVQTAEFDSWHDEVYLHGSRKFYSSYAIVDRDKNGNHIYGYEREKVFKNIEDASKFVELGKHWIRMKVVHMLQINHSQDYKAHNIQKVN